MPGFNKKGPKNQGPMTGGRRGICIGSETQEDISFGQSQKFGTKQADRPHRCRQRGVNGLSKTAGNGRGHGAGRRFR